MLAALTWAGCDRASEPPTLAELREAYPPIPGDASLLGSRRSAPAEEMEDSPGGNVGGTRLWLVHTGAQVPLPLDREAISRSQTIARRQSRAGDDETPQIVRDGVDAAVLRTLLAVCQVQPDQLPALESASGTMYQWFDPQSDRAVNVQEIRLEQGWLTAIEISGAD
jgi:hypothetical protein